MKLFKVCNRDSSKAVEERYFENKAEAKKFRDEKMGDLLKQEFPTPLERAQVWQHANSYKVALGPDHRHYKGA